MALGHRVDLGEKIGFEPSDWVQAGEDFAQRRAESGAMSSPKRILKLLRLRPLPKNPDIMAWVALPTPLALRSSPSLVLNNLSSHGTELVREFGGLSLHAAPLT